MFEQLFKRPSVVHRHKSAPYAEERERYLIHCAEQGYTKNTLLLKARELLWVARKLDSYPDLRLSRKQIKLSTYGWKERERACGRSLNKHWTRIRFYQTATAWLRFLGCLREAKEIVPFVHMLEEFCHWMESERGLASTTIQFYKGNVSQFLRWYGTRNRLLSEIRLCDVDDFMALCKDRGYSRVSLVNVASAARSFLRYAGAQKWCDPKICDGIRGPRLFSHESLPMGPSWTEVTTAIIGSHIDKPVEIRNQAIMMLCAFYGLRASEVSNLKLGDIDWEHDSLNVLRAKNRGCQKFPLLPSVGNAIGRYLKECRPKTEHRTVFLSMTPPLRPLSRSAIYDVVRGRLSSCGVRAARMGPHSLRHACARHLASEGFSLKEIGDHLGHRSSSATSIYAKVDLSVLREIAAFDLGELR